MSTVHADPSAVPKAPLLAIGGLLIATLVTVTAVRVTGIGVVHAPEAPAVATRELRFDDQPDGSITVAEAVHGRVLEVVAPGTNGFLRGTMRGLARERHRRGVGAEPPFRMVGHADGRLTLEDPATGRHIDLGSFGPTNAAVFGRIMTEALRPQRPQQSSRGMKP